jgi:hypothetical protein
MINFLSDELITLILETTGCRSKSSAASMKTDAFVKNERVTTEVVPTTNAVIKMSVA